MKLYELKKSKIFDQIRRKSKHQTSQTRLNKQAEPYKLFVLEQGWIRIVQQSFKSLQFLYIRSNQKLIKTQVYKVVFQDIIPRQIVFVCTCMFIISDKSEVAWIELEDIANQSKLGEIQITNEQLNFVDLTNSKVLTCITILLIQDIFAILCIEGDELVIRSFNQTIQMRQEIRITSKSMGCQHFEMHSLQAQQSNKRNGLVFIMRMVSPADRGRTYLCTSDSISDIKLSFQQVDQFQIRYEILSYKPLVSTSGPRIIVYSCDLLNIYMQSEAKWQKLAIIPTIGKVHQFKLISLDQLISYQQISNAFHLVDYDISKIISFDSEPSSIFVNSCGSRQLNIVQVPVKGSIETVFMFSHKCYVLCHHIFKIKALTTNFLPEDDEYSPKQLLSQLSSFKIASKSTSFALFQAQISKKPQVLKDLIKEMESFDIIYRNKLSRLSTILTALNSTIEDWDIFLLMAQQYLSIFIYLAYFFKYIREGRNCDQELLLSTDLDILRREVLIICEQKLYEGSKLMQQIESIRYAGSRLPQIARNARTICLLLSQDVRNSCFLICNLKYKDIVVQLSLSQLVYSIFNHSFLVQFLIYRIFLVLDQTPLIHILLKQLIEQIQDYPPLVYLIAGCSWLYLRNKTHFSNLRRQLQLQRKESFFMEQKLQSIKDIFIRPERYERNNLLSHLTLFSLYGSQQTKYDSLNLYIRTGFSISVDSNKQYHSNPCQVDQHDEKYLAITEEALFEMMSHGLFPGTNQIILSLSVNNKLFNFHCTLYLLNERTKQLIMLQNHEIQAVRRHNFIPPYQCIPYPHHQTIKQPPNAYKQLFSSYLKQLLQICQFYDLNMPQPLLTQFSSTDLRARHFEYYLRQASLNISEIVNENEPMLEKDIHQNENQPRYMQNLEQNLWDMYLIMVEIQNEFEIYQEINDELFVHHFIQIIQKIQEKIYPQQLFCNDYQEDSTLDMFENVPLQLNHFSRTEEVYGWLACHRSLFKIYLRSPLPLKLQIRKHSQLAFNMVKFCYQNGLRWIGDPTDLLQQIISLDIYWGGAYKNNATLKHVLCHVHNLVIIKTVF